MTSQSKANSSPVALSTKNPSSKPSPSPTPKKQPNTLRVDLSSKLASNGKLTSDECKKCLKNNLCLYCGTGDHKLDFCPKKQTTVSLKGRGTSATADTPAVKIVNGGLYFILFLFLFFFFLSFLFLFLEQLGLGLIGHAVTSVTSWWRSHKTDHETWENLSRRFENKWRHTTWTPPVDLMDYTWLFRVGCTVASTDHL